MQLRRLNESSPLRTVAAWREMWNGEVLPYLRSLAVVAGSGIAVRRHPAGTVVEVSGAPVSAAAAAPPAAAGYNSYFKLTLSSATSGEGTVHTVTIADGATGGDSLAVVNGYTLYSISPYTEAVTTDRCFFLKYTPAVYDDSGAVTPATLVIGSGGELPSYLSTGCFYTQLGRVIFTGGVPSVVQDFTAGVADVRWYVKCVN